MFVSMCLYMFWLVYEIVYACFLACVIVCSGMCVCGDEQYATDTRCQWAQAAKPHQAGNLGALDGLHQYWMILQIQI